MIQQVIPMDLIPSYLIYVDSLPLSDVLITFAGLPPHWIVPTRRCCEEL